MTNRNSLMWIILPFLLVVEIRPLTAQIISNAGRINVTGGNGQASFNNPTTDATSTGTSNILWRFLEGARHWEGVTHDATVTTKATIFSVVDATPIPGNRGTRISGTQGYSVEMNVSNPSGGPGVARAAASGNVGANFEGSCLGGTVDGTISETGQPTKDYSSYYGPSGTRIPRISKGFTLARNNIYASKFFQGSNSGRTTYEYQDTWTYTPEDPWAMLTNKSIVGTITGPEILLEFKPKNSYNDPVDLPCLAKAMGFDSFNWVQHVTVPSPDWTMLAIRQTGEVDANGKPVYVRDRVLPNPVVDPHTLGPLFQMMAVRDVNGDGDTLDQGEEMRVFHNPSWDTSKPYNDVSNQSLPLNDTPWISDSFYRDGDLLSFESQLVGVNLNENGAASVKPLGIGARWKSNAHGQGGSSVGGVFDFGYLRNDGLILPATGLTGGGIFDFKTFSTRSVPESNSSLVLALMIIARTSRRVRQVTP